MTRKLTALGAMAGGFVPAAGYLCLAGVVGLTIEFDNRIESRRGTGPGRSSLPSTLDLRRQG